MTSPLSLPRLRMSTRISTSFGHGTNISTTTEIIATRSIGTSTSSPRERTKLRKPWNLPNSLIYLQAFFFKPGLLRPDLKVSTLDQISWKKLKERGYNAVVIDKDNCLTYPNRDELHPSVQSAWLTIKQTFGPQNVLIVSNSVGTAKKDYGGIGADSVSRLLGVPVLIHSQPKPGCGQLILDYFNCQQEIRRIGPSVEEIEREVEREYGDHEGKMARIEPDSIISNNINPAELDLRANKTDFHQQPLRILVIGDRLATDVILAKRLNRYISAAEGSSSPHFGLLSPENELVPAIQPPPSPAALSIITTTLFKKDDVRSLRWLENTVSRISLGKRHLNGENGYEDWSKYLVSATPSTTIPSAIVPKLSSIQKLRSTSRRTLTWVQSIFTSSLQYIHFIRLFTRQTILFLQNAWRNPRLPTLSEVRIVFGKTVDWTYRLLVDVIGALLVLTKKGLVVAGKITKVVKGRWQSRK